MPSIEKKESGLKKSLGLIFVYTVATGSIFTYVSYWDSVFFSYCGAGTFLAFALMTLAILPVALVYSELSPLFHTSGGELIYNTVGMNKHVGFLASWLIMAAWISVPPAVCMAIATFFKEIFGLAIPTIGIVGIGVVILLLVFAMSMQNITFLVKVQAFCLFANIATTLLTAVLVLTSGHWSISNLAGMFNFSNIETTGGIPGWIIGMALLITPFFGFETVPQMVEEGDFPIKESNKAILGSIVTCGVIYALFFFGLGGMPVQPLVEEGGAAVGGFLAITMMEQLGGGWGVFALVFGVAAILCAIGTCLLGFWLSTVRLLYAMGENNFLPKVFTKVNRHQQPILPNILLLAISLVFLLLQNATTFMNDFFNLMSFGCACAYAITMISAMRIHKNHPELVSPYKLKGGNFTRVLALIISVVIAFFCTLGQSAGSWKSFGIYIGIGALLWLWMVLVNWKKHKVTIETVAGTKEY